MHDRNTTNISDLNVYQNDDRFVIEGDLSAKNARELLARLQQAGALRQPVIALDAHALDILDGSATALAVDAVRALSHQAKVTLIGAPQALAHVLYRIGALGDASRIELIETRQDEAYG